MNILVTGGAGFIGSNLVHFLLERAESETSVHVGKVVNVDLLTYAGNRSSLADLDSDSRHLFVQADILDEEKMLGLLREHSIDAVMHLAAESHVDRSIDGPEAFIQTNFVGSFRLLQAARTYWSELEGDKKASFRFLHVSTDEVYGTLHENDPAFSETTPYAPNSPYSASKAGSDFLVRAYHHTYGLPVVTTNCSNNYGPFQFPEKLIPLMIRKIIRGEKLPVYGDGSNIRDWLYVEDHGRGLFCALTKGRLGETYNIGGKCEMKNIDVVHTLLNTLREKGYDHATPDLITYVKDRPGHDWRYAIDCSKIETELGWRPLETFETGMAKTVQWYLDNTEWIEEIESGTYRGERLGQS